MKTYIINIENKSVTINGQSCNFIEAGLTSNADPVTALTSRSEIVGVLQDQNDSEKIEIIFEGGLADILANEIITMNQIEPNVQMFVDNSSIYWVSKDGQFVWMADHRGIADYIDENHRIVEEKTPEGVGSEGVYWMNSDFEAPFHISDFFTQIETINV